jgi:hypothetical protein
MTGERSRNAERQQLWAEYEAALWSGLAVIERQNEITGAELEQLGAVHRKMLRTLSRLRELKEP